MVGRSKITHRFLKTDPSHDLCAVIVGIPPGEVASPQSKSAAVAQQVSDHDLSCGYRVMELEIGQDLQHGVVPGESVFLDQQPQGRGRERLGVGGDGEQGLFVHRVLGLYTPGSKALLKDDLVLLYDGHGQSGDLPVLDRVFNVRIQVIVVDCPGRHGFYREHGRDPEAEQAREHESI